MYKVDWDGFEAPGMFSRDAAVVGEVEKFCISMVWCQVVDG